MSTKNRQSAKSKAQALKNILRQTDSSKVTKEVAQIALSKGLTPKQIQTQAKSLGVNIGTNAKAAFNTYQKQNQNNPGGAGAPTGGGKGDSPFNLSAEGSALSSGFDALNWLTKKNPKNEAVSGAVNDSYFNVANSMLQTGVDVNYAKNMMPLALEYQRGMQNISSEADMKSMAAEGAIARDLLQKRGEIDTGLTKMRTDTDLAVAKEAGFTNRYMSDNEYKGSVYRADTDKSIAYYSADRGLEGLKYRADTDQDIAKYGEDAATGRNKDTLASAELQIGLRGAEDRRTLIQSTDETLRLRADARGAIKRENARMFG